MQTKYNFVEDYHEKFCKFDEENQKWLFVYS